MSSAWDSARGVEARSLALLSRFLEDAGNRWVLTAKGRLGRHLQETCGDLLLNDRRDRLWGIELKAEEEFTGNLFLETWSNLNLRDPQSHADRGSNVGWMFKTRADLLFYHFLSHDLLVIVNLFALKRWAFDGASRRTSLRAGRIAAGPLRGRLWDFPEREQGKYRQMNDTWGRCVPLAVLEAEIAVKPQRRSVAQMSLDLLEAAA